MPSLRGESNSLKLLCSESVIVAEVKVESLPSQTNEPS